MMKKAWIAFLSLAVLLSLLTPAALAVQPEVTLSEQYLFAGRNGNWYTEEAYRASPVVTDLDGDGTLEVLNAAYSLVVMDAATGAEKWRVNSGCDRSTAYSNSGNTARQVFTDFEVLDVDADGRKEIVIAYGNGSVSVLNDQGYFEAGWPQRPTTAEIRSLAVADLDGDGRQEIIVGAGTADPASVWVYRCDGTLAAGWPQLARNQNGSYNSSVAGTAYSYGVFGDGIAVGDLTGDGLPEIIVPTDTAYIDAYRADGTLVEASDIYGGRAWGKIALYEDYAQEIACENEGWGYAITGDETRAELYRAELGHSAAVCTDVDGDGTSEIVVTALMTDRTSHSTTNVVSVSDTRYMTAFILNQDRSRYVNEELGFDWSTPPVDLGGALKSYDPVSMAANVFSEPVCADLDGDGYQEILFNSYNGKLHCFSLDGEEHGSWPFTLPKTTSSVYEYATPPVCVDLTGDGKQEVIFASWTDCASGSRTGVNGALYVVNSDGELLDSIDLHDGYASYEGVVSHANGVMGSPTVEDIDGDGKYEILLNTTYYALCVYEVTVSGAASPAGGIAYASTQEVLVDGKPVVFYAYALKDANGNLTNYVKLRDVAQALNETNARFEVGYDGTISITTGSAYTSNGSEMVQNFSGNQSYTVNKSPVKVDGKAAGLEAITLTDASGGGYTYFKLRDLGRALGFDVSWTGGKIVVDPNNPYSDAQ